MKRTIRIFADDLTYGKSSPLEQPVKILIAGGQFYKINIQWEDFVTDGDLLIDMYIPTRPSNKVRISVYKITEGEYNFNLKKFAYIPHIEEVSITDSPDIINPYFSLFPTRKGLTWVSFVLNFLKHHETNRNIPTDPTGFIP